MFYSLNPRRKRRRNARRRRWSFNRRHRMWNRRHRRKRHYNRRGRKGRRRYSRNPDGGVTLRRPMAAIMAGFKPNTLMKAGVVVGGAIGNAWLASMVSGFLPEVLKTGPGNYLVGLGTAGLLGAGVGMLAPRFAAPVFFGGVLEVVTRAVKQYIVPLIPGIPKSGMEDYLTVADAAAARPLGYFGDYLTPADAAAARPLGYMGQGDEYISEELAAL